MQIILETSTARPDELTALIALCASLGGRLPANGGTITNNLLTANTGKLREVLADVTATVGPNDGALPPESEDVPTSPTATGNSAPASVGGDEPSVRTLELDTDGIPWDERIHASTKTKTAKGVWTKKRNVDEVEYGRIHAELQEQHAPLDPEDDTPPPPSDTSAENAPTDDTDVPPPPADDASAASDGFADFAALVAAVAPFNLPYVKLAELAGAVTDGLVAKFPDLKDKPDYWSAFFEAAKTEAG